MAWSLPEKDVLETDGSLVSYDVFVKKVWSSETDGKGNKNATLTTQNNGELVVACNGNVLWTVSDHPPDRIEPGHTLYDGGALDSPNGKIGLRVEDGFLVMTNDGAEIYRVGDRFGGQYKLRGQERRSFFEKYVFGYGSLAECIKATKLERQSSIGCPR